MAKVSLEKDKIKFLLVEGVHQKALESLRAAGYTNIEFHKGALDTEQLKESIRDAHFIGLRSRTHLTEDVIDAAEKLVAIGCFCIGTNQVDLTAAAKRGIPVFNAPFSNTRSVAELVIGELLLLLRGIPEANAKAHRGVWNKLAAGSYEARGKKLGIIGYGHIGTQLGILAESLGMHVYFYDIENKLPLGNATQVQHLSDLLNMSDVVSLHVPENASTKNLMGAREIALMKPGALLINAGIDRGNTDEIVQSIADYIDVDDSPRFHGAEDSFYQSQTPPRHSANQMLFLTGELRQIKGITENIYQRLIPYVCVLPTSELSINLNMLTENDIPLFRALFLNNITDADARVLLQKRPREGWLTTDAFLYWAQQDFSGVKPLVAQVKRHLFPYSRYFTLSTESISDEQSQGWQSHIFFNRKQQSAQIYRRTLQLY